MRECEEILKIVQSSKDLRLDLAGGSQLASRQKLKRYASWSTTEQKV